MYRKGIAHPCGIPQGAQDDKIATDAKSVAVHSNKAFCRICVGVYPKFRLNCRRKLD